MSTNNLTCDNCGQEYTAFRGHVCPDSDAIFDAIGETPELSDPETTLEQLVERASVPDLGALYRRGRESGAIQPEKGYASAT